MKYPLLGILGGLLLVVHAPLRGDVLAYFPFDTNFEDASGMGNDLTVGLGTPVITNTAGEFVYGAGALSFTSTESDEHYLVLDTPVIFGGSDPWTISFWGRRAAGSTNRQGMVIGDRSNRNDFIWLSDGGGGVEGIRFRNSAGTSYNNGSLGNDAFPDDGEWHHWVVVADGSGNLTVYRDNVSLGAVAAVTTFRGVEVGQGYNQTHQSHNGQIDELYIFDEALDEDTVESLFDGTFGQASGISLQVDLDESGSNLVFTWGSQAGKVYDLLTSTDPELDGDPTGWAVVADQENIASLPPTNTLTIPLPADDTRFYAVLEKEAPPPPPIFEEDFENGGVGWVVSNGGAAGTDWVLGNPAGGTNNGPPSAFSPDNCYGTNILTDYQDGADVSLVSPAVAIPAGGATLRYQFWIDTDVDFDFGVLDLLDADSGDALLETLDPRISGFPLAWDDAAYVLPASANGKNVKFRFRFTSDSGTNSNFGGWYIDDVTVTAE